MLSQRIPVKVVRLSRSTVDMHGTGFSPVCEGRFYVQVSIKDDDGVGIGEV